MSNLLELILLALILFFVFHSFSVAKVFFLAIELKLPTHNNFIRVLHNFFYSQKIFRMVFAVVLSLFINMNSFNISYVLAADIQQSKIIQFQDKFSKNISRKFCNSIGFGLSKDSSLKFSLIENNKEMSNSKYYNYIDKGQIIDQISTAIVEDCGYNLDLIGQKGVEEFRSYLIDIDIFSLE